MAVILLILKIIGIVLLILLGLLLLALMLVLFVPVHYMVSGGAEEEIVVHFRVSWLLSLISWKGYYRDRDFDSQLRIFGIRKKTKATLSELEEEAVEAEADAGTDTGEMAEADAVRTDEAEKSAEPAQTNMMSEAADSQNGTPEAEAEAGSGKAAVGDVKKRKYKRHQNPFNQIKIFFENVKMRVHALLDALVQWRATISNIKSIILDETNKTVLVLVLSELKYLLGHFKFREIDTNLTFSLGDPARTGQALGVLCMMPFMYQYRFNVYPDFESEKFYVRGTFRVEGRVRGVHAVVSLIRLVKKKEVRALIKKIKNR